MIMITMNVLVTIIIILNFYSVSSLVTISITTQISLAIEDAERQYD